MEISGKVVIITGASEGIGLATARIFSAEGSIVVLAARSADRLNELADELHRQGRKALPLPTDMRQPDAVNRLIETAFRQYGRIDVLINNAGQAASGTVAEIDPDDFRKILELNVFGALSAIQAVIPKMRNGGGGLIINISSMVTKMHLPGLSAYAASKAALNMLSETARVELAPENIRVVTVYPRITATDFGKHSLGNRRAHETQRAEAPKNVIVDSPEHVAEKILEAARNEPAEQYMEE